MNTHGEKLSVVIPVLGDNAELARLLEQLAKMPDGPDEVIVVDGADDATCRAHCHRRGVNYLATPTGRGLQLDTGARSATGEWLWFLHADATPPEAGARAVREALASGQAGGWFRFRFAGAEHFTARLLEILINLRCRVGTPYGDQGLFMTAAAYRRAGGFPHLPLFEEVALVRALRRLGPCRPLPLAIGVSTRRWDQAGWWRRSLANRRLAIAFMLGRSPASLARRYQETVQDKRAQC